MISKVVSHEWVSELHSAVVMEIVPYVGNNSTPQKYIRSSNRLRFALTGQSAATTPVIVDVYCADQLEMESELPADVYIERSTVTNTNGNTPSSSSTAWTFIRTISFADPVNPGDAVSPDDTVFQTEGTITVPSNSLYLRMDMKGTMKAKVNHITSTLSHSRAEDVSGMVHRDKHVVAVRIEEEYQYSIVREQNDVSPAPMQPEACRQYNEHTPQVRTTIISSGTPKRATFAGIGLVATPIPPSGSRHSRQPPVPPSPQSQGSGHEEAQRILTLRKQIGIKATEVEQLVSIACQREAQHELELGAMKAQLKVEYHAHLIARERYLENQRRMLMTLKQAGY